MYNLKFGCQSYPWKMGKHFGQLPRMLKVAAEAGFQSIECEIDMLGTWLDDLWPIHADTSPRED